ncbi:MAG TPA: hypothetical protein VNJ07_02600 [Chitinophagales bacterium]|nr:hypothetical protein [Chitinophagales bacterium]
MKKLNIVIAVAAMVLLLSSCAGSKCDCPTFGKGKKEHHHFRNTSS